MGYFIKKRIKSAEDNRKTILNCKDIIKTRIDHYS